jgi:hypothetical protein
MTTLSFIRARKRIGGIRRRYSVQEGVNLVSSKYWQTPEFLLLFRNRPPFILLIYRRSRTKEKGGEEE